MATKNGTDKQTAQMLTRLRRQGWRIDTTGPHLKCYGPRGQVVFGHKTASDHRSWRNLRAKLRRHGAHI